MDKERILDRPGRGKKQRTLAEIVQRQGRQRHEQPSKANRAPAEMTKIGVERLAAGHDEEHGAERCQADDPMLREE